MHVWSFHMTLSFSRDPFACFVTSQDLASFWDCHRRAFDHFGGVPATIVYDRTQDGGAHPSAAQPGGAPAPRGGDFRRPLRVPHRRRPRPSSPVQAGWSARWPSCAPACSTGGASPRPPRWTTPSPPGCPCAEPRSIAPTARGHLAAGGAGPGRAGPGARAAPTYVTPRAYRCPRGGDSGGWTGS
ncbi:MAG: DDE-type integrase/transposase/recombinase [Actinomycetota bacterium]|nr:DDE-type integrase/transposase/recombinase [Actinomycetota bacterium]